MMKCMTIKNGSMKNGTIRKEEMLAVMKKRL